MTQLTSELFKQAKACLSPTQKELVSDVQTIRLYLKKNSINDYSFLVAPAAKAYEGYLKDFFLKIGLIDSWQYKSDRFRVGKTLNPSLRYKRFSIFQKLADIHDTGEELAEILWDGWKYGRNEIFHYFPKNLKKLTLTDAENRIVLILSAIIESDHFLDQTQKR
jgi:hypothetical protein